MNYGLSDQVRSVALERYVKPAIEAGKTHFSVAVRDLMRDLQPKNFPSRNWPQICSAIQSGKFLRANGLEIEGIDGPPSKQSPTVIVRYRLTKTASLSAASKKKDVRQEETPEEWAERVTKKLQGLMKEDIAAHGGAEGYIRWVRSHDEDAA